MVHPNQPHQPIQPSQYVVDRATDIFNNLVGQNQERLAIAVEQIAMVQDRLLEFSSLDERDQLSVTRAMLNTNRECKRCIS